MGYPVDDALTELEQEFERSCWAAIDECRYLRPPYNPTAWITMIQRHGAAEAARRLVINGDIQAGFDRLIKEKRPELTVEWAMLDPHWDQLFDRDPSWRQCARWRLQQAGIHRPQ